MKGLIAGNLKFLKDSLPNRKTKANSLPEEADISDIDSLYQQSIAETVEMPAEMAAEMAAAAYASDRMDDDNDRNKLRGSGRRNRRILAFNASENGRTLRIVRI